MGQRERRVPTHEEVCAKRFDWASKDPRRSWVPLIPDTWKPPDARGPYPPSRALRASVRSAEGGGVEAEFVDQGLVEHPGDAGGVEGTVHHLEVGDDTDRSDSGFRTKRRNQRRTRLDQSRIIPFHERSTYLAERSAFGDADVDRRVDDASQRRGQAFFRGTLTEHPCVGEQSVKQSLRYDVRAASTSI